MPREWGTLKASNKRMLSKSIGGDSQMENILSLVEPNFARKFAYKLPIQL